MAKTFFILLLTAILILVYNGCRVDIIEPNNPAGNKNFPVKEGKENYFNIAINAEKLTTEMNFDTYFSSEQNMISLKVNDKQSGSCTLKIISTENKILYSSIIEISEINIRQRINQGIPSKVRLTCDNFTGKIKLEINKSNF
jgi:hypothetical protein